MFSRIFSFKFREGVCQIALTEFEVRTVEILSARVGCKELTYDIMTFIEENKKIQNEIVISE